MAAVPGNMRGVIEKADYLQRGPKNRASSLSFLHDRQGAAGAAQARTTTMMTRYKKELRENGAWGRH